MKDEYIRREDAVNAVPKERVVEYMDEFGAGYNSCRNDMLRSIDSLESADVVHVVRCRDCEHYYFADNRIPQEQRYVCEISGEIWKPDDFCSFGKRREE